MAGPEQPRRASWNSSEEERDMRAGVIAWALERWPDAVVLQELPVGPLRIDLAFVTPSRIVGVEVKSSRDTLARMNAQLAEFTSCMPEVWLAMAPSWWEALLIPGAQARHGEIPFKVGRLCAAGSEVSERYPIGNGPWGGRPALVDRAMTSPVLHLLTRDEILDICATRSVFFKKSETKPNLLARVARALTGDEVIAATSESLRRRAKGP